MDGIDTIAKQSPVLTSISAYDRHSNSLRSVVLPIILSDTIFNSITMREIKFRAWHKKEKEMFRVYSLHHLEGRGILVMGRGGGAPVDEDCVLMQYTGLKDNNGKEIYEGDVLATSNDGRNGGDVWDKEDFGYAVVREDTDNLLDGVQCKNWFPNTYNDNSVFSMQYVEVIGNIYENPDLMS